MLEQKAGFRHDLPRSLGVLDATAIIIGIVIGSGIFVLPNLIARNLPSGFAILSAWVIAGVLSFFGALAYAELGAMMPATGGQYVYLREAYGPMWAFVSGWTFMLAVLSGGSAWLAVTFSIYVRYFIPLTPALSKVLSLALIAALSAVNYVGVREGAWVQRTFTYLKIGALLVLIGAAFLSPHTAPASSPSGTASVSLAHFGVAMAACLMAYNGWAYVSFVAGEVRDPQRNLLRSLAIGMGIVGGVVRACQCGLPESAVGPTDRDDRTRRRGHGDRNHGLDRWKVRIRHRAAFDRGRSERLRADRRSPALRPGAGRAVLRPLR